MERISFVFTICFVLLGPIKIVPAFARATAGAEPPFRRRVAVWAALVATAMCLFVLLAGRGLVSKYELSLRALELGGGLVLLLSALNVIFPRAEPKAAQTERPSALQVAIAPLATPVIVTPAGIAALLLFVMSEPAVPGMYRALAIVLPIILALDFVVMIFNAPIVRLPGLLPALQVLGSILIFIQVALAIDTMLDALRKLGVVGG